MSFFFRNFGRYAHVRCPREDFRVLFGSLHFYVAVFNCVAYTCML